MSSSIHRHGRRLVTTLAMAVVLLPAPARAHEMSMVEMEVR